MLDTILGPSIKYVTLEGREGVRESVTVCDRGGSQEHVTSHFLNFVVIHMKREIESDV